MWKKIKMILACVSLCLLLVCVANAPKIMDYVSYKIQVSTEKAVDNMITSITSGSYYK